MNMLLAALLATCLQDEPDPKPKPEKPAKKEKAADWQLSWAARIDLDYNSNIWLLDGDDGDRLLDDLSADQISGRFDGMESIEDWIVNPSIRFAAKGPSPFGRKLDVHAELEVQQYAVNGERSYLRARLGADQSVGKDGKLELDLSLIPDYFHKNYLVDATDFTGSNSASERIYDSAHYLEFELGLKYRHTLVQGGEVELDGVVSIGLRARQHDSTFAGRNEFGLPLELGVRAKAWKRVKAKLAFQFEPIDSPVKGEVLLLDEPAFAADLNGDGDMTDTNARTVQSVDRSRRETSLVFGVEVDVIETVAVALALTRTWKDWSSGEAFDVSHRDRSDVQDKIEFVVKVQFSKQWEGRIGVERTVQGTDRPADPGASGETSDYQRNVFTFAAIFRW